MKELVKIKAYQQQHMIIGTVRGIIKWIICNINKTILNSQSVKKNKIKDAIFNKIVKHPWRRVEEKHAESKWFSSVASSLHNARANQKTIIPSESEIILTIFIKP